MAGSESKLRPEKVYLIPGFMSPRWMLLPLAYYLRRRHKGIITWDYPRIFTDVASNIDRLVTLFEHDANSGARVGVVAHSFGDWIARQALDRCECDCVKRFISVSPVVRAVPIAQLVQRVVGDRIPEISIMADENLSSMHLVSPDEVDHDIVWARWEWLVRRGRQSPSINVNGTHNSLLFQPEVWRLIENQLFDPKNC